MDILETIRVSIHSLRLNKMRSALTALGIIIGVGSVIAMISLGAGARIQVTKQIQAMGTNLVMVTPGKMGFRGMRHFGSTSVQSLTLDDADYLKNRCNLIKEIAPQISDSAVVKYKSKTLNTTVSGVPPVYFQIRELKPSSGRLFYDRDNEGYRNVCVLGNNVKQDLFADLDPVNMLIKLKNVNYRVIGVLESKGEASMGGQDDQVFIPLSTAQLRMFGTDKVRMISMEIVSEKVIDDAIKEIEKLLRIKHKIYNPENDDFTVRSQKEMQQLMENVTGTLTLLLGGIAAISLLVGGIGIMNIMLVTVTERTREIGIRKAVGAKRKDILVQFLVESITLSLVGGFVGILLGIGGSVAISKIAKWTTTVTPISVFIAFFFSIAVGLFFGIYPANKASKLNPIEALRYE